MLTARRILTLAALCLLTLGTIRSSQSAAFGQFVDRYLDDFARRHPSIAAGNGTHTQDGRLEDMSPAAVAAEIAALKRDRAALRAFDPARLSPDERVDQRIMDGIIDGWLLEQETLQNWRRNPMIYAAALSDGVHNLMTMEYAPAPVRMRRVISKLRALPGFLAAARANIVNPPRLLAERGAAMMRGAGDMLAHDLRLALPPKRARRTWTHFRLRPQPRAHRSTPMSHGSSAMCCPKPRVTSRSAPRIWPAVTAPRSWSIHHCRSWWRWVNGSWPRRSVRSGAQRNAWRRGAIPWKPGARFGAMFGNGDPRYQLAQLSDAMTRICRLISGIKLHTRQWTLDDAQACFEEQAYVPMPAARREAERGAYDPTYGGYFLGKLALLKLRADYQLKMGTRFSLREFHERIMLNGIAPIWAHRQLLLPGDNASVLD